MRIYYDYDLTTAGSTLEFFILKVKAEMRHDEESIATARFNGVSFVIREKSLLEDIIEKYDLECKIKSLSLKVGNNEI